MLVMPREAKSHRHDRNTLGIVEYVLTDPHPVPQPHTRGIVERPPGPMHPKARRLPGHEDPRAGAEPGHRARRMRRGGSGEALRAKAAGGNPGDEIGHRGRA